MNANYASAAASGPLDSASLDGLIAIARDGWNYDKALQQARVTRDRVFDEISLAIVIHHGIGAPKAPGFYETKFRKLASRNTVKNRLLRMADLDLLELRRKPTDLRSFLVFPTKKLVDLQLLRIRLLYAQPAAGGAD